MKHKRRGIVLCGAYGMENTGDDAVLAAILDRLHQIDRSMPVTVMTRRPSRTPHTDGIRYISFWNAPAWLFAMCRARLFLSGGGTLLQDVTSRRSLWFYLLTIRFAKFAGCAVQLYGCGIGPLSGTVRKQVADILNTCADAATLRDADSLRLLEDMGITTPRLLLSADPALTTPPDMAPSEPSFGFVLRNWADFAAHIPDFAAAARYVWQSYRLKPVFLCMAPADRSAARAVCALLPDIPCDVRPYERHMTAVLSMRLHGLIFSLRDNLPAGGICYDPKVDAFCRDAGYPYLALKEATAARLTALIDRVMTLDRTEISAARHVLQDREQINGRIAEELLSD